MKITTVRRISQTFFFILFGWLSVVASLGTRWFELRGWPVNWFLQIDPLAGLATVLSTHTLYHGLAWGVLTVVLTLFLGRFFCGWVCPFGALQQAVGFMGRRSRSAAEQAAANRYHRAQSVKYWILIFLLTAAAGDLIVFMLRLPVYRFDLFLSATAVILLAMTATALKKMISDPGRTLLVLVVAVGAWANLAIVFDYRFPVAGSLQSGLLDPISLLTRSVSLVCLPLVEKWGLARFGRLRFYDGAFITAAIFFLLVLINFWLPRFYCRFVCPLGALLGVLSRFAVWRVGKGQNDCHLRCHLCETHCEGACSPSQAIRSSECVLCLNCLDDCFQQNMRWQTRASASGEVFHPDISRRAFVLSAMCGAAAIPVLRLGGTAGPGWHPGRVRPPGALDERSFLSRCIKCGLCMRVCPTNVIQPDWMKSGLEGLWSPVLDFRMGTSGCQINCIACGHVCPTAAIRPLSLDERLGIHAFADKGPVRIGTAFVDRGRCLPWAMDRPCIVCQENCPVSPKAIFTRVHFEAVRMEAALKVGRADPFQIDLTLEQLEVGRFSGGDYYVRESGQTLHGPGRIIDHTASRLMLSPATPLRRVPSPGSSIEILIRLQRPFVDIERCVGCGVCVHECPVKGKRAIRVTAENESRENAHALMIGRGV